ncbi:o-succinylbenzoate--CoA ligase [Xenorhabdus nematophila]|uniref:o-succinylbenzoate--CoA ligase n=1 Tax=Xenorhabdus nematophila TaxID=628 RepID=UPI000542E153|nr:o-succinylbenzoate--CoA ligase [Xenorhabdus nematophila]CEF32047.1 o-succinylbenzoate-CoA ligase [Xenorhabdus nematophila str. Websteri]AYA39842.1 o-succinylbenzoate--CoA ligase [Xenorhabdus nematophila]KHD29031.1 O-succinylbenzoic acid--CoA ligase [Xenorhabdus nematophila]MBA0018408.1 o-succinylbenzoate--CoA ligase [Xenorhabdus nematophila]MCB4425512.1 o-succinylbenzoate--CoA ligase [Xenorhabdus nematophila]
MPVTEWTQWPWQYWAMVCPDKQAVELYDELLSWQHLTQKINAIAVNFYQQGLYEGCGVVFRGKNSTELLLCYLAALRCGARVLLLNPQLPEPLLTKLLPHLNLNYGVDFADSPSPAVQVRKLNWQQILPESVEQQKVSWESQRPASMILTSGSSGLPKAAVHSIGAHLASAQGILSCMDFQPDDSWLLSLPLFHVSGQGILWRWLQTGAKLVLRDLHPLNQALSGCTHASLVPTQLWRLLNQPREHQLTLKEVLLGGAMIPTELAQQAEQLGICCWCGYGLTEVASTVCAKKADSLPGVGLPLPGKSIRLVNEEIQIRADSIASGYWFDGELKPLTDNEGWFLTRDHGVFEQGELRILGRLDNQFFSGGEGIQPEEIEQIINQHPQIEQSFVIPIPDIEFGHRPVAIIDTQYPELTDILVDWLSDKLAVFQRPVACYLLPIQLKNGGIKVSRQQVKQWMMEKEYNNE